MTQRRYLNQKRGVSDSRNNIGGEAILPAGASYPTCQQCGQEQLLFLQFSVPAELGLPIAAESQLSIFMCPKHNEIPSFEFQSRLKDEYWSKGEGNWAAFLAPPDQVPVAGGPRLLEPVALALEALPQEPSYRIAVAGEPQWVQEPERFVCSCGTEMVFICQISDSYKFQRLPTAPEQPDSSYVDDYVLFLGNEVFVFACPKQCNTRAIWITVQN
jgi:hypothetical protein